MDAVIFQGMWIHIEGVFRTSAGRNIYEKERKQPLAVENKLAKYKSLTVNAARPLRSLFVIFIFYSYFRIVELSKDLSLRSSFRGK